ncbi:MAG: exodeoxyribonuclease VII small subunit, partial [Fenollaria timonensis]
MTLNYEKTLDNLDDILEKLQSQELSLDESIDE